MKKPFNEYAQWVEHYNSQQGRTPKKITGRPNFAELTSEHFNGGSGDMVPLYEVAKFLEKMYDKWITNASPKQ